MMVTDFYVEQFVHSIDHARRLYVDQIVSGYLANPSKANLAQKDFFDEVEFRFRCLIIKTFLETAESDLVMTPAEGHLASVLVTHLLREKVSQRKLNRTLRDLSTISKQNDWQSVLEPMTWFEECKASYEELKSELLRIANIAAKVDGSVSGETISQLKMIQWQLDQVLTAEAPVTSDVDEDQARDATDIDQASDTLSSQLIQMLNQEAQDTKATDQGTNAEESVTPELTEEQRAQQLADGMQELDSLIGIHQIRDEVKTLINVCKLQKYRESQGLPVSSVSLHMVFTGNPGTGKTTVARIIGKLFSAIGVVSKGHLVETDRSGLVAEFQGQTATKTNKIIDDALDGILFIDEAYSLAPEGQADSYGQEAIQTLLKRMEDDRDRLVVILAGYPEPMNQLLQTNAGLTSRFARRCHFPDYGPDELLAIFEGLSSANHYQMSNEFRSTLTDRIQKLVASKDEHFGNGRLVRNLFETAIRNLANRAVSATEMTPELVSTFTEKDLA